MWSLAVAARSALLRFLHNTKTALAAIRSTATPTTPPATPPATMATVEAEGEEDEDAAGFEGAAGGPGRLA